MILRIGDTERHPGDIAFGRYAWGVDPYFLESWESHVADGWEIARHTSVAVVMICRNSMPHLARTLPLIDRVTQPFLRRAVYVFENDSTDSTAEVLDAFSATRPWVTVEHDALGGPDERGFQPERTARLAACRARCQEWVRGMAKPPGYVVVLDSDGHGGFDPDGVYNSIKWLAACRPLQPAGMAAGCMASASLFLRDEGDGNLGVAQYDAWAARMNDWRDTRQHHWFHLWMPATGSPPVPMYSAFGGLAVYTRDAYLAGTYRGGDCEHVAFHRSMREAGHQLYLNPGSRYVAVLP